MGKNSKSAFLKKFKLLIGGICGHLFLTIKNLNISKLFIGYAHDSDVSAFRKQRFNSFYMYLRIVHTRTMSDVDRELEHGETIAHDVLTEFGSNLPVFLCFCRQIIKHENPHNSIFV